MKERFISAILTISTMCVALRGSGTTSTSYLRSQHRQLRADNLTISAADGQENGTNVSLIPVEEAMTMEQVVNGTDMLEGDKVELPTNASNATLLEDSSPHADDDVNATIDSITPVTLNSSLTIEKTSMIEETNNTSTDEPPLDMSNSTNNTSSLTETSSTLAPPPLNGTAFEEEESLSHNNVTDNTSNATNATTIADLDLATFNATTSAPTTTPSSSSPTATVAQTIVYSPTVKPTQPNGFNTTTTSVPLTSTPSIAVQALNHTASPTIRFDSVAMSSPPTIAPTIRSSTVNPTQESEVPTLSNLDSENATSSNSTLLMTSSEPSSQPTQDYDDDNDYNYDDDGPAWTYDGEPANVTSPTPTPLPTYPPSTTVEANSTIYQIYYPIDFEEEEEVPTDSPSYSPTTHYPTYSPTTTRKGDRVRKRKERRKKNRQTAPTGSPTVVTKEFLEDVSASKTVGLVIGIILTIFGIGCCAWCV